MGYNRFGQQSGDTLPVGATVDTVIKTNDPAKPNWLNISNVNTLVDITQYPAFSTVSQSNLVSSAAPTDNLSSFLTSTWLTSPNTYTTYVNGLYWAFKDDNTASYARVWTSVDGVTWTEKANLTKDSSGYARPEQIRVRKLSDGYVYVLATTGIYRTNNNGTTWTHLAAPTSSYWGDIAYNGTTYVLTGDQSLFNGIDTTTDFVTFTNRYTVPYASTNNSQIFYSPTFTKFYVHSCDSSGNHKVSYSTDGITGWTDATLTTGASGVTNTTGREIVEFKGSLVICIGGASSAGLTFKSTNGTSWSAATNITNAIAHVDSNGEVLLATPDALYYKASTGNEIWFVNDLVSSAPRKVTGLGNSTTGCVKLDTVNNYVFSTNLNFTGTVNIWRVEHFTLTNKVIMPVQNSLVRLY